MWSLLKKPVVRPRSNEVISFSFLAQAPPRVVVDPSVVMKTVMMVVALEVMMVLIRTQRISCILPAELPDLLKKIIQGHTRC